jgi:predicted O-methyltransferase YrrM
MASSLDLDTMQPATPPAVDTLIEQLLLRADPTFLEAVAISTDAGLPLIAVSAAHGKLLHILARAVGARRALEVGTLGGFSALWIASALGPDGKLTTLELEPRNAEIARSNLERFGLADRVDIEVGPALASLARMEPAAGLFDFVFIDADKQNNPNYLAHAVRLTRPGALIVLDNAIREGAILNPRDPMAEGARAGLAFIGGSADLIGTAIQTVGEKGYDGFALALRV